MTKRINGDDFLRIKPRSVRTDLVGRFGHVEVGSVIRRQVTNGNSQCTIDAVRTTIGTDSISLRKRFTGEYKIAYTNTHNSTSF